MLASGFDRWRNRGVVFLGVNTQDSKAWARQYERDYGIHYETVIDTTGRIGSRFGITGHPETFFIDPAGRILGKWDGPIDAATLDAFVQRILTPVGAPGS